MMLADYYGAGHVLVTAHFDVLTTLFQTGFPECVAVDLEANGMVGGDGAWFPIWW